MEKEYESKIKKIDIEDLSIYDLLYYNEIIKSIFSSRKEREEKRLKNNKYFIYYEVDDLTNYNDIFNETSDLLNKCTLIIYFNCESFKEILIKINLKNDKYDEIINRTIIKAYNFLLSLKKNLNSNRLVENFVLECFQLKHGYYSGYYNLDKIELDFGEKQESYLYPIVVKTKIKYYKIINKENKYLKLVDTLKIDRDIVLNLIQVFLRTTFETISNGKYYGNNNVDFLYELNQKEKGGFIKCNRNQIIEFQDKYLYEDTEKLFNYFDALSYEEKNTFMQSCDAYLEGLKSNNGKELMFFIISIENLANYEFNSDEISKTQKIFDLIKKIYNKEIISREYLDYMYELRSQYSHLGIANNKIKQNIFDVFENNKFLLSDAESLAYSILIKWLISKGEEHGK